jgi:ATP-binding cassette subfamily B protein
MIILYRYLRNYWKLALGALALAAVNQVFSLLDPLIFRHIIDSYATRYKEYTSEQFLKGVSLLLGAAVSVAFISRVAKNFQDYFVNLITQQVGAPHLRRTAFGIRWSCRTPSSKTSAAVKRWANCRRSEPMWRSSFPRRSIWFSQRSSAWCS